MSGQMVAEAVDMSNLDPDRVATMVVEALADQTEVQDPALTVPEAVWAAAELESWPVLATVSPPYPAPLARSSVKHVQATA